jgi:Flp pilus assembly protein TadG
MKTRGRKKVETGAAAVEMALVLPLLFLLVFGIVEFGFIFNRKVTIAHAAREGARHLAIIANGDPMAISKAEQTAEDAAPDLQGAGEISCAGSYPSSTQVQMKCDTSYKLRLYLFNTDVDLNSTAKAKKE